MGVARFSALLIISSATVVAKGRLKKSMTEKAKGLASDSFKRACFNWGIGRELYDYPLISIKLVKGTEWDMQGDRAKQLFGLKLKDWVWFSQFTDDKLNYLACKDEKGNKRFEFGTYIK